MATSRKRVHLAFLLVCTTLLSGCTDIAAPEGAGPNTGKICVTVDTDEEGPVTLNIQAVAFGGPNAGTKVTGTTIVTGPFKGEKVCTNALTGDPETQKWEVVVTVSKGSDQVKRKAFDPQTYKY